MGKRTKGLKPARGFGQSPEDLELAMTQIMTIVALKAMAGKLSELDSQKNAQEWIDWAMQEAGERLEGVDSEEELTELILPTF
jgi:hypothetical protein